MIKFVNIFYWSAILANLYRLLYDTLFQNTISTPNERHLAKRLPRKIFVNFRTIFCCLELKHSCIKSRFLHICNIYNSEILTPHTKLCQKVYKCLKKFLLHQAVSYIQMIFYFRKLLIAIEKYRNHWARNLIEF